MTTAWTGVWQALTRDPNIPCTQLIQWHKADSTGPHYHVFLFGSFFSFYIELSDNSKQKNHSYIRNSIHILCPGHTVCDTNLKETQKDERIKQKNQKPNQIWKLYY